MECKGLRLKSRRFLYWFEFDQSAHKKVQYFFTFSLRNDYGMSGCDHQIKGQFNGNSISTEWPSDPHIFRICDKTVDLSTIKNYRKKYLKKVFLHKLFLSGFCCLIILPLIFFSQNALLLLTTGIMSTTAIVAFLYYLVGLWFL